VTVDIVSEKNTGPSAAGYHRLAQFVRCPQMFAYRWILGLRDPIEGEATGTGTVLHELLRAWYLGLTTDAGLEGLAERYQRFVPRALELFERYCKEYPTEEWEVLDAEREIEVALNECRLTRRLDLIVLWRGRVYVVDHKTAGRVASRIKSAFLDWSLATQEIAGEAVLPGMYGAEWGGFILNVIGTGEGGAEFRRQVIRFPPHFLATIPRSMYWYLQRIDALAGTDPWCYPRSGACEGRYGMCEYLDLCRFGRVAEGQYEVER